MRLGGTQRFRKRIIRQQSRFLLRDYILFPAYIVSPAYTIFPVYIVFTAYVPLPVRLRFLCACTAGHYRLEGRVRYLATVELEAVDVVYNRLLSVIFTIHSAFLLRFYPLGPAYHRTLQATFIKLVRSRMEDVLRYHLSAGQE